MVEIGQLVGNYTVTRQLGEGGMGAVYEAVHKDIGKRAAIKVLLPHLSQNANVAVRFQNEARAASIIDHPGIVEIFEFGRLPDGSAFIVMELLKGEPLSKRLSRGPFSVQDMMRLGRQACSVLAAAHEKHIVHRDLKPDNVFIVPDPEAPGGERTKILDFGIAKLAEEYRTQGQKTVEGSLLGTPTYMAPEQCRDSSTLNDRADVYAFGIMFYEMLAGYPPFRSDNLGEMILKHCTEAPPPLREVAPHVPEALAQLIHSMLAKNPDERPPMRYIVDVLEQLGAARTGVMMAAGFSSPMALPIGTQPTGQPTGARQPAGPHTLPLEPGTPLLPRPSMPGQLGPGPTPGGGGHKGLVIGGIGLGVLLVGSVGAYFAFAKKGTDPLPPTGTVGPKTPPERPTQQAPELPPGMVYIPDGSFPMGSTDAEIEAAFEYCEKLGADCRKDIYEREKPLRKVKMSGFFLDKTEVTNADFAAWLGAKHLIPAKDGTISDGGTLLTDLDATGSGLEFDGTRVRPRAGAADRPVVRVSWNAADAYCRAQGKTLPTEAQWEYAARGSAGRRFPWGGDEPACDGIAYGRQEGMPCTEKGDGPSPAGTSGGDRTPEGVMDLGGNVAEWVADRFLPSYQACAEPCADPVVEGGDAPGKQRVIRGGVWDGAAELCRGAGRSRFDEDQLKFNVGFRCAKSKEEGE